MHESKSSYFARFTWSVRMAVARANLEALSLGHDYIDAHHVLLGILKEDGATAKVLSNFGVTFGKLRLHIDQNLPPTSAPVPVRKLPQTLQFALAMQAAIEEADLLSHREVGTEHVVLGLLRDQNNSATLVLRRVGVRSEVVREAILSALAQEDS